MEPKNEFKSCNSKSSRNENFGGFYNLGSGSLESLETRVPDDVNDYLGQFSLKSYISQIKSVRTSNDFDLNQNKSENNQSVKSSDNFTAKPLTKYERLQKLEKSLNGIQSNVELKRSTILEDIYQKINSLESKITDSECSSGKKMDLISKKIERIEKTIEMVNTKHEEVLNEKADAIDNICEKFHNSLTQEQENWREGEKNILNSVKSQIESVKDEMSDMQRVKSDIMSKLKGYIEVELPKFKIKIESADENICKMEEKIINNTSDDLITLANFIKDEYEQMTYMKDKMMIQLNKEINNLQLEIKKECDEREDTQKRLITLMKETIKKLESPL